MAKKKKKKAFTLIELMAVIIILGIIAIIAVPTINRSIQSSREKTYRLQVGRIEEQAKNWANANIEELPDIDNDITFVTLQDLKRQGYVSNEDVLDPRNNKEMNGCVVVRYEQANHQYIYTYDDKDCVTLKNDEFKPEFIVEGIKDQKNLKDTVEVNTEYVYPHVTAKDSSGRTLEVEGPVITEKGKETVLKEVTTNVLDKQFELLYTTYDPRKEIEAKIVITVTVVDTTPPVIIVDNHTSDYTVSFEAGDSFTIPTGKAIDNSGLTPTLTRSGTVNPKVPGTYKVTYTATDSKGNVSTLILTVVVVDAAPPEISVSGNPTNWTNEDVKLVITAHDEGSGLHKTAPYSCDGGITWQASNVCTVTSNQTVTVAARDNTGNIATTQVVVTKIDKTKPNASYQVVSGTKVGDWYNTDVVVKITPNAGQSGVKEYQYCVTTSNSCTPNTTVSGSGSTNVTLNTNSANNHICTIVTSNSGMKSDVVCGGPYKIDKSKPSNTNVTLTLNNASGAAYNGSCTKENVFATITSNATSGMSKFEWQENGGSFKTDSLTTSNNKGTITFTGERNSTIGFRGTSNAGIIGDTVNKTIKIDRTNPTIKIDGCSSAGNCTVQIELTNNKYTIPSGVASDGCGITNMTPTASGSVTPNMVGTYRITYTATDIAGNTGSATLTVNVVDTTKPTLTYTMTPAQPDGTNNWYVSNVVFKVTATDLQGIKSLQYALSTDNGNSFGSWTNITNNTFTISTEGSNLVVQMRAIDNSNNEVIIKSGAFKLDTKNPTISSVSGNPTSWTNKDVTLTVNANSDISGINAYSFDNGSTWQTGNTKTFSSNQTVNIKVRDNAGRISNVTSIAITKIDKVPPVITVDGHTSDYTVNVLTTDWLTEEQLKALGYNPGDPGVESKIQYGYQEATYSITNVRTDGSSASYAPWYKNVYQYKYNYNKTETFTSFSIADTRAQAGNVWSKSVSGWHITQIQTDIDVARQPQWDNYYQPKVDFKCGNTVIYTMPASSNVNTNGLWTGHYLCTGTLAIYSYGNTGSGRNWTGQGGGNLIYYYIETESTSGWVFDKSEITGATSVATDPSAIGYVLPTFKAATGWRDNTAYTASQTVKPVTRTLYKVSPIITLPNGTATDNVTQNLTVTRTGSVTPSVVGDYKVVYTTKDEAGNTKTLTVTYHVTKP